MDWPNEVRRRFEHAGRTLDESVIAELAEHAADLAAEARSSGATADEATRRASAAIDEWSAAPGRFARRQARGAAPSAAPPGAGWLAELASATRLLVRRPAPALLSISTIALGVAAVTIIASLAWGVLFKPLPWPEPHRLVRLTETRQGAQTRFGPFITNGSWLAWRDAHRTVDALGAWNVTVSTLAPVSAGGSAERLRIATVTSGIAVIAGARPALGRLFNPDDERVGAPRVAVLTWDTWVDRFAARRDIVGRTIRLDGDVHTVVGVLAQGCVFPDRRAMLWVPLQVPPVVAPGVEGHQLDFFLGMARLAPGVTREQAAAEATARARTAPHPGIVTTLVFGNAAPPVVEVEPALDAMTREVRPGLLVLLAAVLLLLACAVANVANVQLTRTSARRREMGIRAALGAGTSQLVRQLVVEHALVGIAGGLVGIGLARLALVVLPRVVPPHLPRLDDIAFDWPVAVFAMACAAGAGLIVGVLPAWQVRRLDLVETLAEDALAPAGGGLRLRAARLRAAVMVAQVAAAAVLLVGGALLTRSFIALAATDRGFDASGVMTATLPLPGNRYPPPRKAAIIETLESRLRAVPGVLAAGSTSVLPLSGSESITGFDMRARRGSSTPTVTAQAAFRIVSPGYFRAMHLRLAAGRALADTDTAASRPVVVVNRTFARKYLDEPYIGRTVPAYREQEWEVVGIIADVSGGVTETLPELMVSYRQWPDGLTTGEPAIVARTAGNPDELAPLLRGLLRDIDPELAVDEVRTMEDRVSEQVATPRLYSTVVGGFAALALVIAAVGLFGVLSYTVAQRSRELAVRAALGAGPGRLVRMVLVQGLALVAIGLAIGFGVALAIGRSLGSLLHGVGPHDPLAFGAVAVLLLAVGAIACVVPAARAAHASPMALLRRG
jgi:predicted permease